MLDARSKKGMLVLLSQWRSLELPFSAHAVAARDPALAGGSAIPAGLTGSGRRCYTAGTHWV